MSFILCVGSFAGIALWAPRVGWVAWAKCSGCARRWQGIALCRVPGPPRETPCLTDLNRLSEHAKWARAEDGCLGAPSRGSFPPGGV